MTSTLTFAITTRAPFPFSFGKHKSRTPRRCRTTAIFLSPNGFNISFDTATVSGNFGAIFFGQYDDLKDEIANPKEVVVKCPIASDLGRQLYNIERYTNLKLKRNCRNQQIFPVYMGEVIIPPEVPFSTSLSRVGLVWEKIGTGETLETYLTSHRIVQLGSVLGVSAPSSVIRRDLAAAVLKKLSLIIKDLQSCGIVHRDIKPENLLVVPEDPNAPVKAIDFGSSCDWQSPFKKGLRLATCDPIYVAPEKRLDLFKPAYRFDVYSIGLIVLRCALPSLTEASALSEFVTNILNKYNFSFERSCINVLNGRAKASASLQRDFEALSSSQNDDLYAVLAVMLTEDPKDRADVDDCLSSRLLRSVSVK